MNDSNRDGAYRPEAESRRYFETIDRPHWFTNNAAKFERREADEIALLDPQSTDTVLEIGFARGDATKRIAPRVRRLIGIDCAASAIEVAREYLAKSGVDNVELRLDDAAVLAQVPNQSVDKAFAYDLIEHIPDDVFVQMLRQVARVSRAHAILALYTPCGNHYIEVLRRLRLLPRFPQHIAVRTTAETLRLVRHVTEWRIDALWHSPSYYPGFGLLDRALYRIPLLGSPFRHKICLRLTKRT